MLRPMIHIATVHWAYDHWIDVQLAYFERNIDEPYRVYAWLDQGMMDSAPKYFYATDVPMKEHERKLTLLGDLMAHLPARLYAQLYDAFGIEILYRHDSRQVTIHATITTATPGTLAQIIRLCDNLPPP